MILHAFLIGFPSTKHIDCINSNVTFLKTQYSHYCLFNLLSVIYVEFYTWYFQNNKHSESIAKAIQVPYRPQNFFQEAYRIAGNFRGRKFSRF